MKKRRKAKKAGWPVRLAKYFLYAEFAVIAVVLAVLSAMAGAYKAAEKITVAASNKQAAGNVELAAASLPGSTTYSLDLQSDAAIYVYSKKAYPCNDFRNSVLPAYFSMRCKVASGIWRGYWVKKVDVAGYAKLNVKTSLYANEYTNYFTECGFKGVNRGDFVDLMVFAYDPRSKLDAECNHEVVEEKWQKCLVKNTDFGIMGHCGVPMCTKSQSCDMNFDVSKRGEVYLLFAVNDSWLADVEGVLNGVDITLTK